MLLLLQVRSVGDGDHYRILHIARHIMLSVTHPAHLTSVERIASRAAYHAGKWQAPFVICVGVLLLVMGAVNGTSVETQFWKALTFAAIALLEWEHYGFSMLLDKCDAEIRRLKGAQEQ